MIVFGLAVGIAAILTAIDAAMIESAIARIADNAACTARAESMLCARRAPPPSRSR